MVMGYAGNFYESQTDIVLLNVSGDAEGAMVSFDEFYLIPETFYLSANNLTITKYGMNGYQKRGMESKKNDFNIMVGNLFVSKVRRATLTFLDRHFEIYAQVDHTNGEVNAIKNYQDQPLAEFTQGQPFTKEIRSKGMMFDFTDDYNDPRKGIRLEQIELQNTAPDAGAPQFKEIYNKVSAYVPVFENSTWSFFYASAEAKMQKEGDTNLESLKGKKALAYCATTPNQSLCEAAILDDFSNTIKANKNGTVQTLGGPGFLRSYPNGRFQGAHYQVMGTELRWNLSTKATDINWYFLEDTKEAIQLAFFHEAGTVAETKEELWKLQRSSTGVGLRFLTKSGQIYRFDIAHGDEGTEATVFFNYPWSQNGL